MAELELQDLPRWTLPARPALPIRRIQTDEDVTTWTQTPGFHNYRLFIKRLNAAVTGRYLPYEPPAGKGQSEAVKRIVDLLDQVEKWIDEIPLRTMEKQRYGNLAFRDWGNRLGERIRPLLETMTPKSLHGAIPLVEPYLLQSFGSFSRIDYGTGHELAFAIFLCCLTMLRFFEPEEEEERALVLVVFKRYLDVVWKLQDVYKLEPAGSHGVWGLDDYSFLPYIWGSGQVRDHITSRPPDVLKPPLDTTTLYNLAISRIYTLKTGPFHEHSPQLHSIASSVGTWWKVNQGMFKMYDAEVLLKRVVVQHIPLGGILEWLPEEGEEGESVPLPSAAAETAPAAHSPLDPPVGVNSPWSDQGAQLSAEPATMPGGSSPLVTTEALPPSPTRPMRQGTMPRPKGGRLIAALTGGAIPAVQERTDSTESETSGLGLEESTVPTTPIPADPVYGPNRPRPSKTAGEQSLPDELSQTTAPFDLQVIQDALPSGSPAQSTLTEPDLQIANEPPEPAGHPTSPRNVAEILKTPVDKRRPSRKKMIYRGCRWQ